MNAKTEMADYEARAEAAYTAMYDAAPHNVKDHYEDACLYLAHAIQIATGLGGLDEVERLGKRSEQIDAVYNHQFRYVGR
jgi:hypothetical protein